MEFNSTQAENRTHYCAIHLIAAVVFRESARHTEIEAKAHTLGCIGYYYSGFHIALSALWLTETVSSSSLRRIKHSKLRKLVEEHLKQPRKIKAKFIDELMRLQDLREESNYRFVFSEKKYDFSIIAPKLYGSTEAMFNMIIPYIKNRLIKLNTLQQLQMSIGDGIGDDLMDLHGGPIIRRAVQDFLVREQFST
jgi:hypothetical protein